MDRHAFRADWHDYNAGTFFITLCSHDKRHIFGHIDGCVMRLRHIGTIARDCLSELSRHHPDTEIMNHVVIPNQIHFILSIDSRPPTN